MDHWQRKYSQTLDLVVPSSLHDECDTTAALSAPDRQDYIKEQDLQRETTRRGHAFCHQRWGMSILHVLSLVLWTRTRTFTKHSTKALGKRTTFLEHKHFFPLTGVAGRLHGANTAPLPFSSSVTIFSLFLWILFFLFFCIYFFLKHTQWPYTVHVKLDHTVMYHVQR